MCLLCVGVIGVRCVCLFVVGVAVVVVVLLCCVVCLCLFVCLFDWLID